MTPSLFLVTGRDDYSAKGSIVTGFGRICHHASDFDPTLSGVHFSVAECGNHCPRHGSHSLSVVYDFCRLIGTNDYTLTPLTRRSRFVSST